MIRSSTIPQSETEPSSLPPIVYHFELERDNGGKKVVIEPMLRTYEVAEQRAIREFMDNGYSTRQVSFETWRTDIKLNDIILVSGLKFKVINVVIRSSFEKMSSTITGVRYE